MLRFTAHGEVQIFRKKISIPIMLQSVHDPVLASEIIEEQQCDMIMLVRPLIADPQSPNKLKYKKLSNIVQYDMNNECFRRIMMSLPMHCPRNPDVGSEVYKTRPKNTLKKMKSKIMLRAAKSDLFMKTESFIKNR